MSYSAPYRWLTLNMPYTMTAGVVALTAGANGQISDLGVVVSDLAVPSVQKLWEFRSRQTGEAHLFHWVSKKVVASHAWDLEADTALHPVNDKALYDQVSAGRDITGLRILKETEADPNVPTFAEAGIIGKMTAASGSFSIQNDKYDVIYTRVA